ncbi:MAG: DUF6456 domain-containing protein [Pseudomonadota bacterium]
MTKTKDILDAFTQQTQEAFPSDPSGNTARDAAWYLAHTEEGESIRSLARTCGTHPSTISRAVRKIESARDDPLFDRLLSTFERKSAHIEAPANTNRSPKKIQAAEDHAADLQKNARKFLRRLAEPGAFLLIAQGTEKAGIFCASNEHNRPIAMLPVAAAVEFLRQDWIKPVTRGKQSMRYRITDVGRSFLRRTLADEARSPEAVESNLDAFRRQHRLEGERLFVNPLTGKHEKQPVNFGETPIGWLARRKGPDGKPFLATVEVEAAEKLRSDFEAAQIGPSVAQDWRKFLTPGDKYSGSPVPQDPSDGAMMARDRFMAALGSLGPGLADVTLRTCCFLEGLEACERRMGWSARSGKIVLQLALQRLADHYGLRVFRN